MTLRVAKFALTAGLALNYTLVVLNNLTDYDSNYQFVRHVLMMDATFAGNHVMWRAIQSPTVHTAFYLSIIVWEWVTTALLWMGVVQMVRRLRRSAAEFHAAKKWAMWQSKMWNGQDAAFRMFCVTGIVLLVVAQRDEEAQP
jgi:predicted small integral membrane protein